MTTEEYLQNVSPAERAEYERIKAVLKGVAPDVVEVFSYGMPAFKLNNKPLLYYGVFKDHLSIFPASGQVLGELGDKLKDFKTAKATLSYTLDKPIPDELLTEIVGTRIAEIHSSQR
jgi:uncharacterized protein YdhG (YjbR/CyaY superfamily)